MTTERVARTYYRSLTPDGKTWVDSPSLTEVQRASEGKQVTYQRLVVIEVIHDWEDFDPAEQP